MGKNTPTITDQLTYVLHLIDTLPHAILTDMSPLEEILQRLGELDGRTCTGSTHWRDKNAPGKTAKLYVLHGIDHSCPIHGSPPPGERSRVYIGNKPDRIADAMAALEREAERRDLQRRLGKYNDALERVTWRLKNIFYAINHTCPAPGEDPVPTPSYHA